MAAPCFVSPSVGRRTYLWWIAPAGTGRSQVMDRFSKIPVQVKAGVRDVVVAFVDRPQVETSENLERLQPYGGLTGGAAPTDRRPHLLDGVAVAGPFNPTGVSLIPAAP